MDKQVFEYLRILGFTDEEINYIEEKNDNIAYANLSHVKQIILFLQELELNIQIIKNICTTNVFMITETFSRINKLNNIYYEQLELNKNQIQKIIIENYNMYTINPNELEKIIDYLKNKNCTIEVIRKFFVQNPKVISMKFEDFEKVIKFN